MQGYQPYGPTNPLLVAGGNQRAYHAMEGSKKKKAIDQSLMELRKKFKVNTGKDEEADQFDEDQRLDVHKRFGSQNLKRDRSQSEQISANPILISHIIQDNADFLMQQVTNLYVGNLSTEVTEEILTKVFCKFGEIESVKVMWPRTEEERKRKRNCGFVKFYKYESAFLAKETLNESLLIGMSMRINWGKGISQQIRNAGLMVDYKGVVGDQDLEMQYIENQLNLIIMGHSLLGDDEILESEYNYFPQSLPRVRVKIPEDPLTRYQIDKFAKFIAKEGYQIENEMKHIIQKGREINNQILKKVILKEDNELSNYYQWRTYAYFNGDSTHSWSQHPYQLYQDGPIWIPPRNRGDNLRLNPAQEIKERMLKQTNLVRSALSRVADPNQNDEIDTQMEDEQDLAQRREKEQQMQGFIPLNQQDRIVVEGIIDNIQSTKRSICQGMILAMEYASNARDIVDIITDSIISYIATQKEYDLKKLFAKLFLISDILFNSSNPQIQTAWTYRREFETRLSLIFEHLNILWRTKVEGKLSQKQIKKSSLRLLKIWRERQIYESRIIEGWEATLKIDKKLYYSFHLTDPSFQPTNIKDQKVLDKMKLIMVPELKNYFKRIKENNLNHNGLIERECKLSGVPLTADDLVERLVSLQEYKIRKVLKSKIHSEASTLEQSQNKDIMMTQYLRSNLRKSIIELEPNLDQVQVFNLDQRKQLIEKAIQDLIQEIVKIRNQYLKVQQSMLQLDEKQIDGSAIQENDLQMFDFNYKNIERNERLIAIAQRALEKGKGNIDLDNLSLDSDELITTQEDIQDNEDIDGVELSESDEIFLKNTQNEECFSAIIPSDHLKKILKYARQKRLLLNKRQQLKQMSSGNKQLDQELIQTTEQLDNLTLHFNRDFEKLDEKEVAFHRVSRWKKRFEKDLEQFEADLYKNNKLTNFERLLKLTKEKLSMYKKLHEKLKQEAIESQTKNIYQQQSKQVKEQLRSNNNQRKDKSLEKDRRTAPKKSKSRSSSSNSDSSSSLENSSSSSSQSKSKSRERDRYMKDRNSRQDERQQIRKRSRSRDSRNRYRDQRYDRKERSNLGSERGDRKQSYHQEETQKRYQGIQDKINDKHHQEENQNNRRSERAQSDYSRHHTERSSYVDQNRSGDKDNGRRSRSRDKEYGRDRRRDIVTKERDSHHHSTSREDDSRRFNKNQHSFTNQNQNYHGQDSNEQLSRRESSKTVERQIVLERNLSNQSDLKLQDQTQNRSIFDRLTLRPQQQDQNSPDKPRDLAKSENQDVNEVLWINNRGNSRFSRGFGGRGRGFDNNYQNTGHQPTRGGAGSRFN